MKWITTVALLGLISACEADETVRAYGAGDKTWVLSELDGQPFDARVILTFPEAGAIAGRGPCNSYGGAMTVPYPWFEVGPLRRTKALCPEIKAEDAFMEALSAMSLSEVLGNTLILSTPEGRKMVFTADD